MTADPRQHPDYRAALDRSRPLEERRAAYARWADSVVPHIHPGQPWHTHVGGDRIHTHEEATR